MRAITINEIHNFERGGDAKQSMGIGKISEVKKILDLIYSDPSYLTYKIHGLLGTVI
jgi:hypothetical protein